MRNSVGSFAGSKGPNQLGLKDPIGELSTSLSRCCNNHIKLCQQIKGNILNNLSTFTQRESNERKAIKRERNEKELGPFDPIAKPLGLNDPNGQLSHARSR